MTNEETEEKRPSIAEKVKFWQEQDKINQELIPRVIKVHETVANHIEGHEEFSAVIASMDTRIADRVKEVETQFTQESTAQELRFVEQIKDVEARVTQETEARFTQRIHRVRLQAMAVAAVSLVVAVVSIVLSVVSL